MKKALKPLLKVILTILLLGWVLYTVDFDKLVASLRAAEGSTIVLAFIFFNLSKIVSAVRLNIYFRQLDVVIREIDNLILYYVGMFYNLFLPGGIGGDGYKAYLIVKRHSVQLKTVVQALLLDRLSGLAGLILLTAALTLASRYSASIPYLFGLSVAVLLLIYPLFYLFNLYLFKRFLAIFYKTLWWGLLVQVLQLVCAWFILRALQINDYQVEFLALFLISSVAAVLPLTIGGVGIRELTMLYGLQLIGLDPEPGIIFSFSFFAITAFSSLLGFLLIHRVSKI